MTLSEWVMKRQETNLNLKKYKQLVQKRKKYFGNKIESKSRLLLDHMDGLITSFQYLLNFTIY
jgi:hypothetical protein